MGGVCCEALGVSLSDTAPVADLCVGSKYSNDCLKTKVEKGFM